MTLQRFQSIVLRLGNQMFVRHYLWLNYPNDPQVMGIKFKDPKGDGILKELEGLGFLLDAKDGIWKIERTE